MGLFLLFEEAGKRGGGAKMSLIVASKEVVEKKIPSKNPLKKHDIFLAKRPFFEVKARDFFSTFPAFASKESRFFPRLFLLR